MDQPHYLRLYTGDEPEGTAHSPHVLATRELLRPSVDGSRRSLEPFTRGWFEELEMKRYVRQGAWLARWLEFTRHAGDSILIISPGLGTDALQFNRHGAEATLVVTAEDEEVHLRDHLHLRGLDLPIVLVQDAAMLPIASGHFDLAYWNALYSRADLRATLAELYRVLKPGGKLFALFPAKYDVDRWQRWLLPLRRFYTDREPRPTTAPKRSAWELHRAMGQFSERRVVKRHLRRSEVPPIWRLMPLGLLERVMGRVLAVKAFKPVSSAIQDLAAAA